MKRNPNTPRLLSAEDQLLGADDQLGGYEYETGPRVNKPSEKIIFEDGDRKWATVVYDERASDRVSFQQGGRDPREKGIRPPYDNNEADNIYILW